MRSAVVLHLCMIFLAPCNASTETIFALQFSCYVHVSGDGLTKEEAEIFGDYFYSIAAGKGSGEYALRHLLAPGAWAHNPLQHSLSGLKVGSFAFKCYVLQTWYTLCKIALSFPVPTFTMCVFHTRQAYCEIPGFHFAYAPLFVYMWLWYFQWQYPISFHKTNVGTEDYCILSASPK